MARLIPISIEKFRANLADFVIRVAYGQERIVVQRYHHDAVVVVSAEEYDQLTRPREPEQSAKPAGVSFKQVYAGLARMEGIGDAQVKDGSTTVDKVLYGEQGAWRGSKQHAV
jgi:prevent-host-death family protein